MGLLLEGFPKQGRILNVRFSQIVCVMSATLISIQDYALIKILKKCQVEPSVVSYKNTCPKFFLNVYFTPDRA